MINSWHQSLQGQSVAKSEISQKSILPGRLVIAATLVNKHEIPEMSSDQL